MNREGSAIRATSKLEVISPKSPLSRLEENSQIRAERKARRKGRNNPSTLPLPQISTRKKQRPVIDPDSQATTLGETGGPAESHVPVTDTGRPKTLLDFVNSLPSWLVSFVVHLALILILAICTFSTDLANPIFLEVSQIDTNRFESMTMEIQLDEPVLEEMAESLEEPELDSELPPLELDLLEPVPEPIESEDEFEVIELAEFANKQAPPSLPAGGDPVADAVANENGNTGAAEGDATEFFGAKSYGSDFVFVIDASSSMMNNYRWTRAVRELLDTVEQLEEDKNFLVLLYNDRSYMMFGAPEDQKLIPATKENKGKITEWLSNATPFGGTQPGRSMQIALQKKPDAIYFLSDGELRDNTMFNLRTWNKPKMGKDGLKRKISIHTILLGSMNGFRTMKTIAAENNGIFTPVN